MLYEVDHRYVKKIYALPLVQVCKNCSRAFFKYSTMSSRTIRRFPIIDKKTYIRIMCWNSHGGGYITSHSYAPFFFKEHPKSRLIHDYHHIYRIERITEPHYAYDVFVHCERLAIVKMKNPPGISSEKLEKLAVRIAEENNAQYFIILQTNFSVVNYDTIIVYEPTPVENYAEKVEKCIHCVRKQLFDFIQKLENENRISYKTVQGNLEMAEVDQDTADKILEILKMQDDPYYFLNTPTVSSAVLNISSHKLRGYFSYITTKRGDRYIDREIIYAFVITDSSPISITHPEHGECEINLGANKYFIFRHISSVHVYVE